MSFLVPVSVMLGTHAIFLRAKLMAEPGEGKDDESDSFGKFEGFFER